MIRAAARLAAVCVVGFMPGPLAGQGRLISAHARADLTPTGGPTLVIDYTVAGDPGAATVPLVGLAFGGARFRDVRATAASLGELDVSLEARTDGRLVGGVALPAGLAAGEPFSFSLSYEIEGATEREGGLTLHRLPILAVGWPPDEALPETFTVEALVADGLTVYESFPSGMRASGREGAAQRYRLALPVIPALVSLRTSRGSPPLNTLPRALNLLVIVLLAGFALLGWRHLRETA